MINDISKKLLIVVASIVTIAGCIYGGRVEYNDHVLSAMGEEKYEYIRKQLRPGASRSEIVKEYVSHQKYYDSITY